MTDNFKDLKFSQNEFTIFVIAMIVSLAAKGGSLFSLSYSIDDFINISSPMKHSNNIYGYIGQGRFGMALLSRLVYFMGGSAPLTNTFYGLLYMITLIWVGLIVCRIWKLSNDLMISLLVVLFVIIHPYQAEVFTFKITPLYAVVPFFLAYIGFYFSKFDLKTFFWTNCCIIFALSIYQIVLNYIFLTLCLALVLEISRQYRANNSINWQQLKYDTNLWPRLVTVCSSVIVYLIINKIVQYTFHVNINSDPRSQFITVHDLLYRVIEIKKTLINVFIMTEPIFPLSLKIILNSLIVLAMLLSGKQILTQRIGITKIIHFFLIFSMLLLATFSVLGVILPMKSWWPVPRVLSAASLLWAGIVGLVYLNSGERFKLIVITLSIIVLFGFIGINNHIFIDQMRLNMRDLHKANRIIERLESYPEFSKVQRVAVVGGFWGYPSPIYTMQGDMNISAFYPSWSKVNILREVSGYNFIDATPDDNKKAEQYCKDAPIWPHPDSVKIDGNLGIVCL